MPVIPLEVALTKCPSCKVAVDMHVLHITSLLGPPAVKCHWCGTVVRTGRAEWWQMPWITKTWFFGVSLCYIVLAFFSGGLSTQWALENLGKREHSKDWGISEPAFWIGGGAWAGLVVAIQLYRIICSSNRRKKLDDRPLQRSLLSFQVGGQAKFFGCLFLVPVACWVIGWIRSW